jgi:integrase/recombinase XerD
VAHVFKPVYTKPIPAGAERVKHRDGPAVRWKGRGGKWVTALVCADNPARCCVEAARWYVEYADHDGRPQRKKGYTDKGATEALMAELVRQSARISSGLLPPEAAQPRRTVSELVDRYRDYVHANGALAVCADRARQRVRDVCDGVKAVRPSDLTPIAVQGWLAERRAANSHKGYPFGKTTSGHYLGAVKSFTRWLCEVDKSEPYDYLSAVRRRQDATDLRRRRRPLSAADLDKLLVTTRKSTVTLLGLTGPERAALYLVACSTGLRAFELSSLTPESFDLVASTVTIEARRAKNKKTDTLALPDDVVRELKTLLKHNKGGPVWPVRNVKTPTMAWWKQGSRMIAADLAAAGIPRVAGGKQFDFHALRGQFATDLDRADVNVIRAQRMMRLSSPALLTKHYAKPDEESIAADVNRLRRRTRR